MEIIPRPLSMPTFNFGLASNFFLVYRTLSMRQKTQNHRKQGSFDKKFDFFSQDPKSHTQVGSLCAKNVSEKFSRLGTFKVLRSFYLSVCSVLSLVYLFLNLSFSFLSISVCEAACETVSVLDICLPVSLRLSLSHHSVCLSVCLSAFEHYLFRTQYGRAVSRTPEMSTKFVDIRAGNGFLSTDPLPNITKTFTSI